MPLSLDNVLEMKKHKNQFGINGYDWFFMDLENNYISKMNGTERNVAILNRYDEKAQSYIVHQLYFINESAAGDLIAALDLHDPFVSDEDYKHINK